MQNLIFYTHPMSRGRTVRWMLEECDAQYETRYLTFDDTLTHKGSMKSDGYLKINPMGKVPALVHNGKVITETAAIITYLAEIFPEKKLIPENRAEFYRWMFFLAGPTEAAFMNQMAGFELSPQQQLSFGYGNVERVVKTIENWLKERTYIAENQFSAADIYAASFLDFLSEHNLYVNEIFQKYCAHHINRSAALKAEAIDNEAMQKMEAKKP